MATTGKAFIVKIQGSGGSLASKIIRAIQPGDVIDIVAPASACTRAELNAAVSMLKRHDLVPRVPDGILGKSHLFANSDEVRLRHLSRAVHARDSKMIWCLRGGYGSIRLLNEMRRWKKPSAAKIFLGFSDITTLHSFFNEEWNWPTLHGPMFTRFGSGRNSGKEMSSLWDILYGRTNEVSFSGLKKIGGRMGASASLRGVVKGGNMAVLQSGLGTSFALEPRGAILFFEDVGERPHRVDRMLMQFALAGWFEKAKAVVFGRFQNEDVKDRRLIFNDVLPRFASEMKIPVFTGLPVGHDPKLQMTLPFNTAAELSGRGNLTVKTGIAP